LTDVSSVVFTYAENQRTYFYDLPTDTFPTVGSIRDFDNVPLPVLYSIAVRLDLSKFVRSCILSLKVWTAFSTNSCTVSQPVFDEVI